MFAGELDLSAVLVFESKRVVAERRDVATTTRLGPDPPAILTLKIARSSE